MDSFPDIFFNVHFYLWERERERARMSGGGRGGEVQREVGTERSEPGSTLTAESPMWGPELTNREIMT